MSEVYILTNLDMLNENPKKNTLCALFALKNPE